MGMSLALKHVTALLGQLMHLTSTQQAESEACTVLLSLRHAYCALRSKKQGLRVEYSA